MGINQPKELIMNNNSDLPWSMNDNLFKELLSRGHAWQALPYMFLTLNGFTVEMPELSIRDDITQAGAWIESCDLIVNNDAIIEVKSRDFAFTSSTDWPSNRLPAFVDTKKKWDAKQEKPFGYIFISTKTGSMVSTCATYEASRRWSTVEQFDRIRKIKETFYTVTAEHLVSMDKLVEALRHRLG